VLKAAPHAQSGASAPFIIAFNFSISAGSVLGGQTLTHLSLSSLPMVTTVLAAAAWLAVALASGPNRAEPGRADPDRVRPMLHGTQELQSQLDAPERAEFN
jgi:hypothetical protein